MTTILSSIAKALFGCGLAAFACVSQPAAQAISVESYSSSSTPNTVTVVTTVNGSSTTQVIPAPYGVQTSVVETYDGTTPIAEASTTPLTQADIQKAQQQEAALEKQMQAMQQQMDQLFAGQQTMFQDLWNGFPQL